MSNLQDFDNWDDAPVPPQRNTRLDAEWVTLNAIREMLGVASKGSLSPSYQETLAFGADLAPQLFGPDVSVIAHGQESPTVREYIQRAEGESILQNKTITPLDIIDREIEALKAVIKTPGLRDQIQRRIFSLEKVRILLTPKNYTENQLILRDLFKAERELPNPPIDEDTYRDYQLADGRGLRIRLLHPDPPEHSVGADLIYETYWELRKSVRLALVQYKIWNGERLLFSQSANLDKQMDKMKANFCDKGLCHAGDNNSRANAYKLPFCSTFLRPTDKLQAPDSRLISSGLHVPICVAMRSLEDTAQGGKKIERKRIRSEALSHKVFEELLNTNMLGSRWLTYEEVETLYREHNILQPTERIILHAQEFTVM